MRLAVSFYHKRSIQVPSYLASKVAACVKRGMHLGTESLVSSGYDVVIQGGRQRLVRTLRCIESGSMDCSPLVRCMWQAAKFVFEISNFSHVLAEYMKVLHASAGSHIGMQHSSSGPFERAKASTSFVWTACRVALLESARS